MEWIFQTSSTLSARKTFSSKFSYYVLVLFWMFMLALLKEFHIKTAEVKAHRYFLNFLWYFFLTVKVLNIMEKVIFHICANNVLTTLTTHRTVRFGVLSGVENNPFSTPDIASPVLKSSWVPHTGHHVLCHFTTRVTVSCPVVKFILF